MAIGLVIGGWFASAVIGRVVTVASPHIEDYFKRWKGMNREIQRLKEFLPQIESVVDAAGRWEQQISDPLRQWLWQLKNALHEADDVLDEVDHLELKKPSRAMNLVNRVIRPDPTLVKLKSAVKKLGEVAARVGDFCVLLSNAERDFQRQETQTILQRETGHLLTENKVFGRENEKAQLLRWLTTMPKDESNNNVSLFSVVGHGGIGKTTLAQLVFNDDIVQKSFDLKIWVCVSTSFDVKGLTRSILESAKKQERKSWFGLVTPQAGIPSLQAGLAELQEALKKNLQTGKFLLILDDVWNDDNSSNWDKLLAPLKFGRKGSKILLTTRMDPVAVKAAQSLGASTNGYLKLGGLHGEDFCSLFYHYAFAGFDHENYRNLHCIGMQIAKRLGSSPLAAKTVGGLLNSKWQDDGYWTKILRSKNILDREHGEDDIKSILMLSYHHLPLYLRPCFAYCSMFPKDHVFSKKELVLMWMAVGLIQHSHQNQGETLEDIGGYYFDELVRRSLFDHRYGDGYLMHDLLHDLAQSVSHGECSSFVDNDKEGEDTISSTVRHLYIECDNLDLLTKMDNWHNLRSLVIKIKYAQPEHFSALEKVLKSLKSIRMLCLRMSFGKVTIPDEFKHLIHLRSLEINCLLRQFPISLCKLYHLQVLQFHCYYGSPINLPESINKLVNLRYLSASDKVAEVGKLGCLQELDFSIRKERGYKIGELGDQKCLRSLRVRGLENVENEEECSTAKLSDKKYLQTLYLAWSASSDPGMDNHELVMDRLQPHANLKKLTIEGYRGIRYANWMSFKQINNLRYICLSNCSEVDQLPPLESLPFLEGFELKNMPAINKLDFQCPGLKELFIYNMEGLEELSGPGGDAGQWHPHLHTLKIGKCPKLEVMPSLSLSIRKIELLNLGLVSLPTLCLDRSITLITCSTCGSLSPSSSLQELVIDNCGKITSLDAGLLQYQHYLTALEHLEIRNFAELVDFPSEGLQHLRALRSLRILNCPKLRMARDTITLSDGNDDMFLPSSLRRLEIEGDCVELARSITTLLKGTVSLDELWLKDLVIEHSPNLVHAEGTDFTIAVGYLVIDDNLLLASGALLRSLTPVRELRIWNCRQMESIDGELEQLFLKNQTSLKWITIQEASSLKSMPGCLKNLSSLQYLTIGGACETLKERCRKDEGADWPTISHIPKISFKRSSDAF